MSDNQVVVNIVAKDGYSKNLDAAAKGIKKIQTASNEMSKHAVSDFQAVSGATRAFVDPGGNNMRTVERFLSQFPKLREVAMAAFPVIGAAFFAKALFDIGEKVVEVTKSLSNMGRQVNDAYGEFLSSGQQANAALDLTNVKLQNQIDKLEHKPENQLAVQLAESKKAALDLAAALGTVATKETEALSKLNIGLKGMLENIGIAVATGPFGGPGANSQISGAVSAFQAQRAINNDDLENKSHQFDIGQAVRTGNQSVIDKATKAGNDAIGRQIEGYSQALAKSTDPVVRAIYQQAIEARQDFLQHGTGLSKNATLNGDLVGAENARNHIDLLHDAKDPSDTIQAKLNKRIEEDLESRMNAKADALKGMWDVSKSTEDSLNPFTPKSNKFAAEGTEGTQQAIKAQQELALIRAKGAETLAEETIKQQEATGVISKQAAAVALAALHTKQYNEELQQLKLTLAHAPDAATFFSTQRQIAEVEQQKQVQTQKDNNTIADSTHQFTDSVNKLVQSFGDWQQNLAQVFTQAINSFNSDVMNGKGFTKTGSDFFRGLGTVALKKSESEVAPLIENGTGSVGKLFGKIFGGGNKVQDVRIVNTGDLGAALGGQLGAKGFSDMMTPAQFQGFMNNALPNYAATVNGSSSYIPSQSSGLETVSPILHALLGGFFADGGDPPVGQASVVGEQGPELFVPRSAGTIIPNKKLGGGGDAYYSIDARGADAAAIEQRVAAALRATHGSAVRQSMKADHELKRRSPNVR